MFLSKLILNPRCREARRDLASVYELHRTLMRAFPSAEAGGPGRVLFRVESVAEDQNPVVLVQSDKQPDWSKLQIPGYCTVAGPKAYQPTVGTGQRLRFRLRANPTIKRDDKRQGLWRTEEQLQWLHRKAQSAGFTVVAATVRRAQRQTSRKTADEGAAIQTHAAVDFEGILAVSDAEQFTQALASGIGSAKGYGFGLLSVARA